MRLSEAILKGCEMVPVQEKDMYWQGTAEGITGACTLGAVMLAVYGQAGVYQRVEALQAMSRRYPELQKSFGGHDTLSAWIIDRNDTKTREEIAAELARAGL